MDSGQSNAGIVDAMHVMSNAANRLVVSAQLEIRHHRDEELAQEIQACINTLLAEFDRLRGLLLSMRGEAVIRDRG